MENQDITTGFQQVDRSAADYLIRFLEDVHGCETVREGFRMQLDWLQIQPGDKVLDIGCGIGDQAAAMAKLAGETGSVTGTDISTIMVQTAKQRYAPAGLPLDFIVAPATMQPFRDASFNVIRTERVLMYLEHPGNVFAEYKRLLKPGGRLLIFDVDWNALVIPHPDKKLTRRIVNHIADSFPSGRIGAELYGYFVDHGFKNVKIRQHSYMHNLELTRRILEGITLTGAATNAFTTAEITGWWAALEAAERSGKFFSSFQGFIVMGERE